MRKEIEPKWTIVEINEAMPWSGINEGYSLNAISNIIFEMRGEWQLTYNKK